MVSSKQVVSKECMLDIGPVCSIGVFD